MSANVEKLKREKTAVVAEMRAINETVEARSDKAITAEEKAKFADLRSKADGIDEAIQRAEYLAKEEAVQALRSDPVENEQRAKSFGEFLRTFISDPNSPRLQRDTTMSNATSAGVIVPPEFDSSIRSVSPTEAIVRPRATVLSGGGSSPDATLKIPVYDQASATNPVGTTVYGGVTLSWAGENATRSLAGDLKFYEVEFAPKSLVGYIDISKQLLDNSAIGQWAENQMRLAGIAAEEKAFFKGTGVGQPTGFLGNPAGVTVTRGTANKITFDDVVSMLTKSVEGKGCFIANRTTLPQLVALKDTAGNNIWQSSAREGTPNMLMGYPVLFSERTPVLGTAGDLSFVDLSYYYIKDGSGMRLFLDPYTRAVNNITRVYIQWNVDAKPILTGPIVSEDGVTRSPFVTLA